MRYRIVIKQNRGYEVYYSLEKRFLGFWFTLNISPDISLLYKRLENLKRKPIKSTVIWEGDLK